MSYKPIQLSQEEIDELIREIEISYSNSSDIISGYEYWNNYDDWDGESYGGSNSKSKRKHDWTPVLLSFVTVYNCKHCDVAKEKATSEYCDEEK